MNHNRKVFIAVMGVTGSGKSTFIKTASQMNVDIGHDLTSCKFFLGEPLKPKLTHRFVGTSNVMDYTFELEDYEITLIDTPGFNDTFQSETTVLKNIASWLDLTYRNPPHTKLNGIVYMQAITDRKMYGSTLRNLLMFRELCGENPLKNVILVTTGWGTAAASGNLSQATENERQLRTEPKFWANMIRRGSDIKKFEDTRESALDIIFSLVDRKPTVLKIQKELVDENRNLIETSAGHVVNEEIKKLEEKYRAELLELAKQMEEAKAKQDRELQEVLAISKKELERLKLDARHAQDQLDYERRNHQRQYDQDLEDMKREMLRHKDQIELQLKAQHIEDRLQFEGIVEQLRANEYKVRQEERIVLEKKIAELEKGNVKNKKGNGKKLLVSLAGILGAVAMSFLGFPLA
jgi:hypothetical protein